MWGKFSAQFAAEVQHCVQAKLSCFIAIPFLVGSINAGALDYTPTDSSFAIRCPLPTNTYHRFCRNIFSQNGEDGIIEELLKELKIENGTFCEFGASDGITSSNTYNLIVNHFFSGIAIEADRTRYQKCLKNYRSYPQVKVYNGLVLYNDPSLDLNAWLRMGDLPYDFDVLSIDIDGDDYYVWENLSEFQPKIVIFEVNSYRDPVFDELPGRPSSEYNIDLLQQWQPGRVGVGCSFISAVKLGLEKGYIPVSFTGNITFVRKDLVNLLQAFPYILSDNPYDYMILYSPLVLWDNKWYTNTALILNTAIRDYYLESGKKLIDIDWLNSRMRQILNCSDL